MNESSEHERETATDGTETPGPDSAVDPPSESEPKKKRAAEYDASRPPSSEGPSATAPTPPLPAFDLEPESYRSWEANLTPARRKDSDPPEPAKRWSASEDTVVKPSLVPEEREKPGTLFRPILKDEDPRGESSDTVIVPTEGNLPVALPRRSPLPPALAATRAGIELGRPLFAVAAIGVAIALGALFFAGAHAGQGVAVGAATAALNLWAFTRVGTAFFSRRGMRASWGLLAGAKLLVLFGGVAVLLKMQITDPLMFLMGYLALPIGIVASQLLGLQPDFDEGEGPSEHY
jgi:hypothetical protein